MAESHVVAALITKRAELTGLIEHHRKEMGRLADDLAHLDATLRLSSPEIDLRTIWIKARRVRDRLFRPGECRRMVLDIFGEAQDAALSSRQIGDALTARRGLEATTVMIKQMRNNAIDVLRGLQRSGTLVPAGRDGHVRPVDVNLTRQGAFVPAHQQALANLVQQNVIGLVRYAQVAAHVQDRNALDGVGEQDRRRQVQPQGQLVEGEDRSGVTEKSSWQPAQRQILRVGRK